MADPVRDITDEALPDPPADLAAMVRRIAAAADPVAIVERSLDAVTALPDIDSAWMLLADPPDGDLVCVGGRGPVDLSAFKVPAATHGGAAATERALAASLASRGLTAPSPTCAPLVVADRHLGHIAVAGRPSVDAEPVRRCLDVIATTTALGLSHARLAQTSAEQERDRRDLALAGEIQRSLLPKPDAAGSAVYGLNRPYRKVSGDFFDFFSPPDGLVRFALGDVSGKGMNAALLMAKTASLFRCLGKTMNDPADLLALINREICETASRGMFVTMVAGVYAPASGRVRFANAGHQPPLLRRTDRTYEEFPADAPPLGIIPEIAFDARTVDLDGGEFFIFTDGLTEYRHGDSDVLGVDGLIQMLETMADSPLEERLHVLLADLDRDGWEVRDDLTVLAIDDAKASRSLDGGGGVIAAGQGETLGFLTVPALVDRVRLVRGAVEAAARLCGFDVATSADIVLAVAEACQNVVVHAYADRAEGTIELRTFRRPDALVIHIRDFAPAVDPRTVRPRDLDDIIPGGLGTHFIREIMDEVDFLPPPSGGGNLLQLIKTRVERE
ncbi:MAG: SpoIIE family protein phosphatase [Alphaproteobacteria bacterium]